MNKTHRQGTKYHIGASRRNVHIKVELFFSILERRLLRRGESSSAEELTARIIAFIKDYNRRAAPFRWTYEGRPLKAA